MPAKALILNLVKTMDSVDGKKLLKAQQGLWTNYTGTAKHRAAPAQFAKKVWDSFWVKC